MSECTRCGNERKVMPLFVAVSMSLSSLAQPDFDVTALPQSERVCGECLTDSEIARELGPIAEFVTGVMIQNTAKEKASPQRDEWIRALDMVRTAFMVRNNNPDGHNRRAALKALGLR